MTKFIQLHLLTAFPAGNLNRDDVGAPKTVVFGSATRLRISSQSLKRAWRTSDIVEKEVGDFLGTRTVRAGTEAANVMIKNGADQDSAIKFGEQVANQLGKAKKENKTKEKESPFIRTETEQLVHLSPRELDNIAELAKRKASGHEVTDKDLAAILTSENMAVDIAMFGRMLASSPKENVEAACQVAHAIGVSASVVEDDFFTAVDDLKQLSNEDAGAGHLGETAFGSAIFYSYICIDYELLLKNLNGDEELAKKAVRAFAQAAMEVPPTGKQNSFATRAYASWVLAEKGEAQPRSLAAAFCRPIYGENMLSDAIERVETFRDNMNSVYGQTIPSKSFNVLTNSGSMESVLNFITE